MKHEKFLLSIGAIVIGGAIVYNIYYRKEEKIKETQVESNKPNIIPVVAGTTVGIAGLTAGTILFLRKVKKRNDDYVLMKD